jgi:hypothetical protein
MPGAAGHAAAQARWEVVSGLSAAAAVDGGCRGEVGRALGCGPDGVKTGRPRSSAAACTGDACHTRAHARPATDSCDEQALKVRDGQAHAHTSTARRSLVHARFHRTGARTVRTILRPEGAGGLDTTATTS